MSVDLSATPVIAPGFRLQWEPVQEAYVLLYPEGMVKLNASAAEILKRCSGERTLAELIGELEQAFNSRGLCDDVVAFITLAQTRRWLELRS